MSFSKTQGLFTCCVALSICLIYITVTDHGDVAVSRHLARESDITSISHRGSQQQQQQQQQNESMMARRIKLGSSISNALYNLYVAKGRPVETSLFISDNQTISIISINDDDDDYDDDNDDYDYDDDDDDDDGYSDDVESDDDSEDSWKDTRDDGSDVDDGQVPLDYYIGSEGKDDNPAGLVGGDDGVWNKSLEGETKFRYIWNEWDPVGWMKLPLAFGNQDTKALYGPAIMFNRVGKCGSRSVLTVLQKLSKRNKFYLVSSLTYNLTKLSRSQEKQMVKVTSGLKRPNIFQRHVHFIDYTRHNMNQPLYINIIRDPLDRMVSQYYYVRFGDDRGPGHYKGTDQYQTFDECVLSGSDECLGPKSFYIIPYFCGQEFNCTKDRAWAFKKAVENLEKSYIVTGILEELEDTFRVFERVLPYFFKGALEIYQSISVVDTTVKKNTISTSTTKHKIKPSPEVSKMMREHMKLEYTFYELVKERFHEQKRRLGIV